MIKVSGLLLVHHVADILLCTPRTVRNRIRKGELEGYQVGRKYVVKKDSVLKFLEMNRVNPEEKF